MLNKFNYSFFIKKYKYFIFDFDGIIKESIEAKTKSYINLFSEYKFAIPLIKEHHHNNGGISRFEKIPLYLNFCKLTTTKRLVDHYLKKFSENVFQLVIDSNWVPGVLEFIEEIEDKKKIYIVSATPEDEIRIISKKIGLNVPLSNIYGSPSSKIKNINKFFKKKCKNDYVFFGDSFSDSIAANEFSIDFAYRRYDLNFNEIPEYYTYLFKDFKNENT